MTEPRLVIIETSGQVGHVGVAVGGRLLESFRLDEARRHARDLAPLTGQLLGRQGWKPRDLAAVVVSRGPGSYTGLRVGMMSAKALAYAAGCKLLAIDTFAALAEQASSDVALVDVLADAQQGRVYVQRFARGVNGTWAPQSPLAIEPFRISEGGAWMTGPGLRVKGRTWPEGTLVLPPDLWNLGPESLLKLGWNRYQGGEADDVFAAEPLYLRPSAAETQWKALGRP